MCAGAGVHELSFEHARRIGLESQAKPLKFVFEVITTDPNDQTTIRKIILSASVYACGWVIRYLGVWLFLCVCVCVCVCVWLLKVILTSSLISCCLTLIIMGSICSRFLQQMKQT